MAVNKSIKYNDLPWWFSGYKSSYHCRGHGFAPWSGKISHIAGQLRLWVATAEARMPQSPCSATRSQHSEKPTHHNQKTAPLQHKQRKVSRSNEDPVQPKNNNNFFLKYNDQAVKVLLPVFFKEIIYFMFYNCFYGFKSNFKIYRKSEQKVEISHVSPSLLHTVYPLSTFPPRVICCS